ncbi:hypothetical protein [uncultured Alistipes sp.]|uniref:hypothetical protein n=1 Tax=uncultured Alistipes sp. TaxID=538949 RepID=UPI002598ED83|nr:hypothetical protein [uncultured Alistipes sp.]
MGYVGERGHVWSSSSNYAGNRNAGLMWFHSGLVNPLDNSNRANAFSVRCVQHLPTAFSPFLRVAAGREPGFFGRPDCATARKPV